MTHFRFLGGVGLLALLMPCAAAMAQSFPAGTATIPVPPPSNDPADRLAANLVLLSKSPKDVAVLIDAGRSAIAVGDYDAALGFFANAEKFAPTNARVKAALGSALVMVERPTDAIILFNEATALGLQEAEFAGDRGLAFDLQGENRRAQRDYQMSLRLRDDDEITRRLALSLGISGDRDAALRLLDPLLRRQDVTGWRARAFVLAMNGGVREAESIAATVMPQGMGDTMRPFLRKLALLNAVDRAHAVNFGTMPADTSRTVGLDSRLIPAPELAPVTPAAPIVTTPIDGSSKAPRRRPGQGSGQTQPVVAAPATAPSPPSPGFSEIFQRSAQSGSAPTVATPTTTPTTPKRVGGRLGSVDPSRLPPELRPNPSGDIKPEGTKVAVVPPEKFNQPGDKFASPVAAVTQPPSSAAQAKSPEPEEVDQPANAVFEVPSFVVDRPTSTTNPATVTATNPPAPVVSQPAVAANGPASVIVDASKENAAPSLETAAPDTPVKTALAALATSPNPPAGKLAVAATQPPFAQPSRGLLGLLDGIEPEPESVGVALPNEVDIKLAKLAAQRKAADAANRLKAEKDAQAKAEKAKADKDAAEAALKAKRNPARTWVQVATGANESGLAITWKRLREKAPDALKGLNASYTPFKATNRILVGPFKSAGDARAVVNALGKAGHSSNLFSSEAGQEILKIATK